MNRILATVLAVVLAASVFGGEALASVERRVALVIGNSAYQYAPRLNNGTTDARAMAETLEGLGFDVVTAYDTTMEDMKDAVEEFAIRAFDADVSLFFYAGHGVGARGTNYLVPVDAAFDSPTALRTQAVDVATITEAIRIGDSVGLMFLDACRDNPFPEMLGRALGANVTRSMGFRTGLSEMEVSDPGKGLAIAFATSPGEVAYDGTGKHSPFTEALLKYIALENTDVATVLSRVTGEVLKITNSAQRPWVSLSLTGPVVLNPSVTLVSAPSDRPADEPLSPSLEAEKIVFEMARDIDEIAQYEAYLRRWPDGIFSEAARARIESLRAAAGGGSEVAALTPDQATREPEAPEATPLPVPTGPLVLEVTDAVKAAPANAATEEALAMDRPKRREVQERLNATGADVGAADGIFGPKTRGGITLWQQRLGLAPTGYLNQFQLEILTAATANTVTPTRTALAAPVVAAPARATQPARVSRPARQARPARATPARVHQPRRTAVRRQAAPTPQVEVYRPRTPQYP